MSLFVAVTIMPAMDFSVGFLELDFAGNKINSFSLFYRTARNCPRFMYKDLAQLFNAGTFTSGILFVTILNLQLNSEVELLQEVFIITFLWGCRIVPS